MKKVLLVASAVTAVIVTIVIIFFISTSSLGKKEMTNALTMRSANEVNELYSQAYGNTNKLNNYDKVINEFLLSAINEFNGIEYSKESITKNGSEIVYRDLEEKWGDLLYSVNGDTIEPSVSYDNQPLWDNLNNLIESRIAYCNGIMYRESEKQPINAINSFRQVIEDDNYYAQIDNEIDKCVELYIEQTLAEAQELIDQNDYSGALSKISTISTFLENNGLSSETVQEKLNATQKEYAEQYEKKAENCFKQKDVKGAIGNIDIAIELCPNESEYKTKKDTYEMYLPFELYESENCLSVDEKGYFGGEMAFGEDVESNNGKKMPNSLVWHSESTDDSAYMIASYNLGGKYDTVSGILFLDKRTKSTSSKGYFEVFGDGKLLYKSPVVSKNVIPKEIRFNVTNIQNLEIRFYGACIVMDLPFGVHPLFGISNFVAQKDFPKSN